MIIKCYLYSNRARQINHKYYSLSYDVDLRLFHDLKQDTAYFGKIEEKAFVYEVEVESEDVIECEYSYLKATSFRIKKQVDFKEVVKDMQIATQTKNKIKSILEGNIDKDELFELYRKYMSKKPSKLTHSEQMKFLAILNQEYYNLPELVLDKQFQIDYYIRLLTYYNKPYKIACTDSTKITDFRREFIKQKIMGHSEFEVISGQTPEKFAYNYFLDDYILNRQITQEQFERLCSLYKRDILTFNFRVKTAAILAGYKILPEYRELFYPFVLYHGVEYCLDLIEKEPKNNDLLYVLFYCGYKFKNFDYSNMPWKKEVTDAKTIFQNGFKYIE